MNASSITPFFLNNKEVTRLAKAIRRHHPRPDMDDATLVGKFVFEVGGKFQSELKPTHNSLTHNFP